MSRPDGEFTAASEASAEAAELLAAFEAQLASARGDRRLAIAELLAAGPGWREARELLGGAFADEAGEPGLKDVKGT